MEEIEIPGYLPELVAGNVKIDEVRPRTVPLHKLVNAVIGNVDICKGGHFAQILDVGDVVHREVDDAEIVQLFDVARDRSTDEVVVQVQLCERLGVADDAGELVQLVPSEVQEGKRLKVAEFAFEWRTQLVVRKVQVGKALDVEKRLGERLDAVEGEIEVLQVGELAKLAGELGDVVEGEVDQRQGVAHRGDGRPHAGYSVVRKVDTPHVLNIL